jgi:hypothetical protein
VRTSFKVCVLPLWKLRFLIPFLGIVAWSEPLCSSSLPNLRWNSVSCNGLGLWWHLSDNVLWVTCLLCIKYNWMCSSFHFVSFVFCSFVIQRFSSQERENSVKKPSCLPVVSYRREDSQLPISRSSSNLIRNWSAAPVPDHKCKFHMEWNKLSEKSSNSTLPFKIYKQIN